MSDEPKRKLFCPWCEILIKEITTWHTLDYEIWHKKCWNNYLEMKED